MDFGWIVELDILLEFWCKGGIFRSMCDRSGICVEDIKGVRDVFVVMMEEVGFSILLDFGDEKKEL